ncbi:MAG: dockerin type I domain-containing protein [Candidatus Zixiibacteriota bacterium]
MCKAKTGLLYLMTSLCIFTMAGALPWPVEPENDTHLIGNSYGQFQCYYMNNCTPYAHSGIDIMVPPGTRVYAIKSGYVKAILTTSAESHWRAVIGDSSGTQECEALMYAHLLQTSITDSAGLSVGDYVEAGQYIGNIVYFPAEEFHHLHFSRIRYAGTPAEWAESQYWPFVGDPLDILNPNIDPDPPVFENAYDDQLLAFCYNEVAYYFPVGTPLYGDVDIVCHVYDYINDYDHKVAPWGIEYKIEGDTSIPWTNAICFSTELGAYSEIYGEILYYYQDDATCNTLGDYNNRSYYFNITSNNGDSVIEYLDVFECWHTGYFHNGEYKISVRAYDHAGNEAVDSMYVSVMNYFQLTGTVVGEDAPAGLAGATVTIVNSGQVDTTESDGDFAFSSIGGGSQPVSVRRVGYIPLDTAIMMNQAQDAVFTMLRLPYICGDVNQSGSVNILDATYLISYLYKGGPAPQYPGSADANNSGSINLLDVTFLISYLYKGGPVPVC